MRGLCLSSIVFAFGLLSVGCNRNPKKEDFVPNEGSARAALEAALSAWKSGQPPGRIEGQTPPVEVFDFKWTGGQKITGFAIGSEDTNAEGHRRFNVTLTLSTGEKQEARYVVLGKNTLSVYREEDYQKLSGS